MKPLYKIETVTDEDAGFNRDRVIANVKKLHSIRKEVGSYVNMVNKNKLRLGVDAARDTVRYFRSQVAHELRSSRTFYRISRRIGKHGSISMTISSLSSLDKESAGQIRDHFKQQIKLRRSRNKQYSDYSSELDIRITERKPNWYLNALLRKELSTYKKPKDNAQYIGLEIECVFPASLDETNLAKYGKWLNIGTDGSIQYESGQTSRELRLLLKREELREVIPALMDTLAEMKATVNKSCGLHVHLDQRNVLTPADNFLKLVRSLNLLYTVVPKSRRENQFCHRNRRTNFDMAVRGERYKAINATAYWKFKTLEVRLFGGTLNAKKIINWVETLHAIVEGTTPSRCPRNFDTARSHWTTLTDENLTWLKERQEQFAALNQAAPFAESDAEDLPDHDEVAQDDDEVYCAHCDESGDHWTSDCEAA